MLILVYKNFANDVRAFQAEPVGGVQFMKSFRTESLFSLLRHNAILFFQRHSLSVAYFSIHAHN